jgi:hypothetical protein
MHALSRTCQFHRPSSERTGTETSIISMQYVVGPLATLHYTLQHACNAGVLYVHNMLPTTLHTDRHHVICIACQIENKVKSSMYVVYVRCKYVRTAGHACINQSQGPHQQSVTQQLTTYYYLSTAHTCGGILPATMADCMLNTSCTKVAATTCTHTDVIVCLKQNKESFQICFASADRRVMMQPAHTHNSLKGSLPL